MIDFDVYLWNRFTQSGNIDDYLTYTLSKSNLIEKEQENAYYN